MIPDPCVTRFCLILTLLLVSAVEGLAASKDAPPPGMGKYVVVLWEPGTPVPGDPEKKMKRADEPDLAKSGGRLIEKKNNLRVVYLPFAAARQMQKHEAVAFIQPLWTGEMGEEWRDLEEQPLDAENRLRIAPDTGSLTWGPKAYEYDDSGNITRIGGDEYTYDSAGRLIRAVVSGKTETYEYDAYGNLTKRTTQGMPAASVPVDPQTNRVLGEAYDSAGNMTGSGRRTYEYDSLNMLTYVTAPASRRMLYDPNDERIGTLIDDSLGRWTFRDFDGQILREFKTGNLDLNEVWIWELDHIRAEGQLVGGEAQMWRYNAPDGVTVFGGMRHHHLDHLGSVRMVTDAQGRAVSEHDYLPFGGTLTATFQEQMNWGDPHVDAMRFAGHWRDFLGALGAESKEYLDNMHARNYDPALGRFLSVDPAGGNFNRPQTWNAYTYARNNPTCFTDPSGSVEDPAFSAVDWWDGVETYHPDDPWLIVEDTKIKTRDAVVTTVGAMNDVVELADPTFTTTIVRSLFDDDTRDSGFWLAGFRMGLLRLTKSIPFLNEAHHIFPRKFKADFDRLGIDWDNPRNGAWWSRGSHRSNAKAYNEAWEAFLRTNPTKEEAVAFGKQLAERYGLKVLF